MVKLIAPIVFLIITIPFHVEATCAWVLWHESSGATQPWQTVGAWADQEKCEGERIAWYGRLGYPVPPVGASVSVYTTGGSYSGTMRYVCLPDTVDPRGPKGAAR
jgi:hypothetical protein